MVRMRHAARLGARTYMVSRGREMKVGSNDKPGRAVSLERAEAALAAFDIGSLLNDDGEIDQAAAALQEQLKARVAQLREQVEGAKAA